MANFFFIDRDIFDARPQKFRDTRVLETWVADNKL